MKKIITLLTAALVTISLVSVDTYAQGQRGGGGNNQGGGGQQSQSHRGGGGGNHWNGGGNNWNGGGNNWNGGGNHWNGGGNHWNGGRNWNNGNNWNGGCWGCGWGWGWGAGFATGAIVVGSQITPSIYSQSIPIVVQPQTVWVEPSTIVIQQAPQQQSQNAAYVNARLIELDNYLKTGVVTYQEYINQRQLLLNMLAR